MNFVVVLSISHCTAFAAQFDPLAAFFLYLLPRLRARA